MSARLLLDPLVSFDAINRDELNRCLIAWGHKMGPWDRPNYGREAFHGLRHNGELVAVTAAASLISEKTVNLTRDDAFELGRVCASRRDLNRVVLRLWREFVFPPMCLVHGWTWVISYQDAALHSGDLYRFDGWAKLGFSHSGTDRRSSRRGRDKVIWGWSSDIAARGKRQVAA